MEANWKDLDVTTQREMVWLRTVTALDENESDHDVMGNAESSDSLSTKHRARSQSPVKEPSGSLRESSVRTDGTRRCMTEGPARRSKTCRGRNPRKKAICSITGLTLHQKALLTRKWNRMESATAYELGRRMFETIFTENPHYLAYIDLKGEPNWNNHINFKIHVQRFVTALSEAMRRLRDPTSSYDVLRDFGASYATYPKRVSAVYFERLANALNQTATQLQEHDHLSLEKAPSREEDSNSSEGDKSYKSLLDVEKLSVLDEAPVRIRLVDIFLASLLRFGQKINNGARFYANRSS
ncbi:hypothetical protein Y032_0051g2105 [Ancylostoma ceylanicum]|uniref:Globin domain-containing protein n=2 Tax=Ancylostoma ceylanicum TaxID=53326 RepID=A0A016U7V7_9BILA|nr:hypothetical protein Y032_0051g2105 [Ancylostoma ceylanicum]